MYSRCGDNVETYCMTGSLGKRKVDYGCSCGCENQSVYDCGYSLGNYSSQGNTNLNPQVCCNCNDDQTPSTEGALSCDCEELTFEFDDLSIDDPDSLINGRINEAIE